MAQNAIAIEIMPHNWRTQCNVSRSLYFKPRAVNAFDVNASIASVMIKINCHMKIKYDSKYCLIWSWWMNICRKQSNFVYFSLTPVDIRIGCHVNNVNPLYTAKKLTVATTKMPIERIKMCKTIVTIWLSSYLTNSEERTKKWANL